MVWGCITAHGVGILTKVGGRLNGSAYVDLLGNNPVFQLHIFIVWKMIGYSSRTMQLATPGEGI